MIMGMLWKGAIAFGVLIVLLFIGLVFFRPWAHIDNYELGYKFDSRDGRITVLRNADKTPRAGYVGRTPFFDSIHTIDLRPRQVCITVGGPAAAGSGSGANARVLNCKLVRFNPDGLDLFLSWHGRGDYHDSALDDLLKIYAYDGSGRSYPFLTILRELRNNDALPDNVVAPATPAQ
jgi:hypothetical protein